MAQVPYSPVPEVQARNEFTSPIHEDTPIAAFGGAVAAATEHLGQVTEGAGKELFARANAMQELNQQAAANEAAADFTTKLGQLHEQYTSLEGKAAVDGYKPYQDSVNSLREDMSNDLSSPYAQRQFNQESRNMQSRAMWMAAGHAAQQNKSYVLGTNKARIDSINNAALANPTDDVGFQQGQKDIAGQIDQQASIQGWSDEQKADALQQAQEKQWVNRIQGLAKSQPFTAKKLLDDGIASGKIANPEAARITDFVTRQRDYVGGRQAALEVMSGDNGRFGAGIVSPESARVGIKGVEGGNYNALGPTTKSGDHALGAYQVMGANLQPWLKEAGMASMSEKEFLGNHEAQDQLFNFKFSQYMQESGSANKAALRWFTGSYEPSPGVRDSLGTTPAKYLQTFNATLAQNASLGDLQKAGQRKSAELAGDDPSFALYVEQHMNSEYSVQKRIQTDNELQARNTVYDALLNGPNGKPPQNLDELKHSNPQVETAVNAMPGPKVWQLQKDIQNYNNAITKQTNQQQMNMVLGLQYSKNPEDIDKFLQLNPYEMGLSQSDMRRVSSDQRRMEKERGGDPSIRSALGMVQPQLQAEGIYPADKDKQTQFRGAFIDAVSTWKQQNPNKPFMPDDAKRITSELLWYENPRGWLGSGFFRGNRLFELPLPKELEDQYRTQNPDISPSQIETLRQAYVQNQFGTLQKPKAQ